MAARVITAIGIRSGAYGQGIDVALVETDGEALILRKQSLTFPYRAASGAGADTADGGTRGDEPEQELTELCAEAVKHFLETFALARDAVALIGFQERLRSPVGGESRRGEDLARATGIDVVYDFGAADIAAGGQGAPLDPVYHRALADAAGLARPLAVVEIGDGATVTYIGEDGSLIVRAGPGATPEAIAEIRQSLPARPLLWLLAGEEARRTALLATLSGVFAEPVHRAEEMGWSVEHFEAEAFAYLAVRSVRRLPLTFPGTTGARQAVSGGRLARAPRR